MGPYLHRGDGNLRSESIPAGGSRPETAQSRAASHLQNHLTPISSSPLLIPSLTRIIYTPREGSLHATANVHLSHHRRRGLPIRRVVERTRTPAHRRYAVVACSVQRAVR